MTKNDLVWRNFMLYMYIVILVRVLCVGRSDYRRRMFEVTALLSVFLVCIVIYYLYTNFKRQKNLPPGPTPWPVFGNSILFKKDPHGYKRLTELSKEYGDIYTLYCGSTVIIILNGYDAIHEAFVKQSSTFTDRPQLFVPLIGVSKGTGDDKPWKELRRFTLQTLRDFGVGKKSLEERIQEEITVVSDMLSETNGKPVRVKPHLLSAATNIICSIMFGARFQYDESKFTELTGVLEAIFKLNAPFAKENFFPVTRMFPSGIELIKKRSQAIEKIKRYIATTIEEHKSLFDPDNIRDFIDLYINATRDNTNPELFTESNVYKIIVDLFLAGGETTGTSLDWALLYMISFPEIQKKSFSCKQHFLLQVIGFNRLIGLEDRVTFSLPHVANKDAKLMGFNIPKDAIIIANLYSAHMDTKYWENPEKFKPERFLDLSGKLKRREAFVPFSTGPRLCIGEPLARMELFLFFANLLQKFNFKMSSEITPQSLDGIQALTLTPLPYELIAVKRH
ncbi:hypothetical protein KUTeg_009524 [Tegillarca granosa]|uniref:Cytochrome P450 n=1 Tax=Tegillarca granosa TaxID=220873 RepID=A0ABQ9F6F2_TEGGR|nr:hypothetical protein KUTeg_009524 [Tegillarca granosa]